MSDLSEQEVDALQRVFLALRAAAPAPFIIVGGWAARLLRRHPCARPPGYEPLQTNDVDVAAPCRLGAGGRALADAILKQGFTAEYRSDDKPPVTRYLLESAHGFELEFIAPLLGGKSRRSGAPDGTVDLLGASAQKLRHVELLLLEPCLIAMPELGPGAAFLVVNPASFVIQRLLILPSRPSLAKKGKDGLYVHDMLQLFALAGRIHPDIVAQAGRVARTLTRKQREQVRKAVALIADARADAAREAARIASEALRPDTPSAQAIALACRLGLAELLADRE